MRTHHIVEVEAVRQARVQGRHSRIVFQVDVFIFHRPVLRPNRRCTSGEEGTQAARLSRWLKKRGLQTFLHKPILPASPLVFKGTFRYHAT